MRSKATIQPSMSIRRRDGSTRSGFAFAEEIKTPGISASWPSHVGGKWSAWRTSPRSSVTTPVQLERKYQQRIIHVTANTSGRDLGSIAEEIEDKIAKMKIPDGFTVTLKGARWSRRKLQQNLIFALVLAILLVYMVLASQFGSLLHPFLIMFSVPLGFIGVALGSFPDRTHPQRGLLHRNHHDGRSRREQCHHPRGLHQPSPGGRGGDCKEAIVRAGRIRLRPILMTSLAPSAV